MGDGDSKVVCVNCGHVWNTSAKRPQCSICKSTRVEPVDEGSTESAENQHADSKDVDDFFELDDVDVDKLLNEEDDKESKESKKENKDKKALRKIGFKIHSGILLIGFAVFFVLVLLKGIIGKRGRRQAVEIVEDEGANSGVNPYSALG
jgi:hypothetical protein